MTEEGLLVDGDGHRSSSSSSSSSRRWSGEKGREGMRHSAGRGRNSWRREGGREGGREERQEKGRRKGKEAQTKQINELTFRSRGEWEGDGCLDLSVARCCHSLLVSLSCLCIAV